jgi:hypothetical protein
MIFGIVTPGPKITQEQVNTLDDIRLACIVLPEEDDRAARWKLDLQGTMCQSPGYTAQTSSAIVHSHRRQSCTIVGNSPQGLASLQVCLYPPGKRRENPLLGGALWLGGEPISWIYASGYDISKRRPT